MLGFELAGRRMQRGGQDGRRPWRHVEMRSLSMRQWVGHGSTDGARSPGMRVTERLDGYQRRHRWAGFPVAVVYKFFEDQGPYLAALITFYGFLSLFPLLLLLASVLGFVLQDEPGPAATDPRLGVEPVPDHRRRVGRPAGSPGQRCRRRRRWPRRAVRLARCRQAVQNAMNVAWSVPRNRRPNPVKARLRSLLLIVTAGVAVLAITVLSASAAAQRPAAAIFSGWALLLDAVAALVFNSAVFIVVFRVATATKLGVREVAPGAIVAAFIWQLLQLFGTAYVANVVKDAGATYGVFAVVLGLLGWIFLAALGVVLSAEINVVRSKHLFPRALLTPFTDNVDLTSADQRAYTDAATAQRHKGFQSVDVTFDNEGQEAGARKRAADELGANRSEVSGEGDAAS